MIYRDFKGEKLSGLGLGMMRLPVINGNDAAVDEKAAAEMIEYAYRHGINYFDTAWGYHSGASELVAGKYLHGYPRDSFCLATKFPGYDNSNMPKAREIFEKQLVKLQTDYFDFYLIHNVYEGNIDDYLDPEFGILEYFLEQKRLGRIRHLGFSCHGSSSVLKRFLDSAYGEHMEFCQLQLNYMDWHFQKCDEKVALCEERQLPVWVMEPLHGGKLCNEPDEMTGELRKMRPDETVTEWAFRFLQALPQVRMVLSGMSDMEQLKANIDTWSVDKPLNREEFDRLVYLMDEEVKRGGLPCTACHYCTSHCPKKLPIPELIALYNEHKLAGGGFLAPMAVGSMEPSKRPANCIGCRSCEKVCPQQIKISEVMKDFSAMIGM
ncbi:MAG: aldo/keto reductase [Saccharofermentans sp.]|jgi:predicted aldo/keto reductase-like oxidoreductase|nr:aldo/keto reductase [Mageeibacillus sp.]MCI1263720.1 aldo/keto reductase [Saccharofermentans sp.]MCI1275782.1 aldo/keto reductase [Saccharofermentans sp.]MCI1769247.1 aldo/keto reductase [Mageeibacillus sp.]MCI2044616.1 aldo/keto reductase [Mageeibacillus sp.]